MAKEYIKLGYKIGIGGVVTFKNAKDLKEVAKIVPLDKLLLETDGNVKMIRRAETPADYFATFDCFEIGKKLIK